MNIIKESPDGQTINYSYYETPHDCYLLPHTSAMEHYGSPLKEGEAAIAL